MKGFKDIKLKKTAPESGFQLSLIKISKIDWFIFVLIAPVFFSSFYKLIESGFRENFLDWITNFSIFILEAELTFIVVSVFLQNKREIFTRFFDKNATLRNVITFGMIKRACPKNKRIWLIFFVLIVLLAGFREILSYVNY